MVLSMEHPLMDVGEKISPKVAVILSVLIGVLLIYSTDDFLGALLALVAAAFVALFFTGYRYGISDWNS